MSGWNRIRFRARDQYNQSVANVGYNHHGLIPTSDLFACLKQNFDIDIAQVPPHENVLQGAYGVFIRDIGLIYIDNSLSEPRKNFTIAHELAHFFLHKFHDATPNYDYGDDPDSFLHDQPGRTALQKLENYNPQMRIEQEANIFAAELLLPSDRLRYTFLVEGKNARGIQEQQQVSQACLYSQLVLALLTPPATGDQITLPFSPELDQSQLSAAHAAFGKHYLTAGPGTGKTRSLTERIRWLIEEKHVPPNQIVAITYTNRASDEMRTRLESLLPVQANAIWSGTIHAYALEILRKYHVQAGLPIKLTILDNTAVLKLLEEEFHTLGLDEYYNPNSPFEVLPHLIHCFSLANSRGITPREFEKLQHEESSKGKEISRIYAMYCQILDERKLLDFSSIITKCVHLLETNEAILQEITYQHPYLLVDETQDTSPATSRLLHLLGQKTKDCWMVGDTRQSIYGFLGATGNTDNELKQLLPDLSTHELSTNYRSESKLVQLLNRAAEKGESDGWIASRLARQDIPYRLFRPSNTEEQMDQIVSIIKPPRAKKVAYSEHAVLCRTNKQAADIAEHLSQAGIPVNHHGPLLNRPEIKDLLALLSVTSSDAGGALLRSSLMERYGLTRKVVSKLLKVAIQHKIPLHELLFGDKHVLSQEEKISLGISSLIDDLSPLYNEKAWKFIASYLFNSDLLRKYHLYPDNIKWSCFNGITHFLNLAYSFCSQTTDLEGKDSRMAFLKHIDRLQRASHGSSNTQEPESLEVNAVQVMTIHQAKGLEFNCVHLPYLTNNQFNGRNTSNVKLPIELTASDSIGQLFFVAISRARHQLYLYSPLNSGKKACKILDCLDKLDINMSETTESSVKNVKSKQPVVIETAVNNNNNAAAQSSISLSDLEKYIRCPQQYKFSSDSVRVTDTDSTNWMFHVLLIKTFKVHIGSRDLFSMEKYFLTEWLNLNEASSCNGIMLQNRLTIFLSNYIKATDGFQSLTFTNLNGNFQNINMHGASVLTGSDIEGKTHIFQFKLRRLKKDDYTSVSTYLMSRMAIQTFGQNAVLHIVSLLDGENKIVTISKTVDTNRNKTVNNILKNLTTADFKPTPSDHACGRCGFKLICDERSEDSDED